jgi:tetratricopeptide (TPR) repeat protein
VARGSSYHLLGQHEKGLQDRTTAIGLDPNSALAYMARGNALYLLGRYDEALSDLKRAVQLDPSNAETRGLQMQAEEQVKKTVSAALAKESKPDTGTVVLPGGPATVSKPNTPEIKPQPAFPPEPVAESKLAEAVKTGAKEETKPEPTPAAPEVKPAAPPVLPVPDSRAIAFHARARQLVNDGNFEEAIEQFTEALRIDSNMPLALNGRGYAHFRLKQYTEAIADFDQAIKLNPAYGNAYMNRGAAKKAVGDKVGSDADLAKARELNAAR